MEIKNLKWGNRAWRTKKKTYRCSGLVKKTTLTSEPQKNDYGKEIGGPKNRRARAKPRDVPRGIKKKLA